MFKEPLALYLFIKCLVIVYSLCNTEQVKCNVKKMYSANRYSTK